MNKSVKIIFAGLEIGIAISILSCNTAVPYKNPELAIEVRVDDLIGRMTLDEKISQMIDVAVAIKRLDISDYNWWNEGLHGVARAGTATVFPQAIGLAATFNDNLHFKIASAISDEFRAKYNDFNKHSDHARYKGLTVWSPNINIFRDPRWGRGQETYGEDPYLTSRMGVAFVKGLQGNDPKYLKVVSTPKHYAVHSGPENLRHVIDVNPNEYDFLDTYMPAFEACVKEGKAFSVMGAYNRLRGKSCSGSDTMLNQILRNQWGFSGYVVSDCDAIADIFKTHKIVKTAAEAAAIGVKAGCDLNCGDTYGHLKEAVTKGFITEKEIDVAVKRLMTARMKLGMFDPESNVAYSRIPLSVNDCPEHRQLAIEAARQSIVLLKNENKILPLKKNIKSIAVLGPNSDNAEVMYGNYNGYPSKFVTPLQGIKKKLRSDAKVYFNRISNHVDNLPVRDVINSANLEHDGKQGLKAEYFANDNFQGKPFAARVDDKIDFNWSSSEPVEGLKNINFSVRWTGSILVTQTGKYDISFTGDDGYRVWIDGKEFFNLWIDQYNTTSLKTIELKSGEKHELKIEYFQHIGGAMAKLEWGMWSNDPFSNIVAEASKCDVIVYCGGLAPTLEGEEMKVNYTGFDGGDRTTLDLPAIQLNILKLLKATGKPVILLLMNGSAIALNWEDKNLAAIVEAWYPGEEGGTAIADILFGDYNPAGRLPVTFYKSTDQLPAFNDYSMKGRTYRYFEGGPLYPFGYGLSYSNFKFNNFQVPSLAKTGDTITVSVVVENTGNIDGDEVVQLYVKHLDEKINVPIHALEGFKRISLKAGEKKTINFKLDPRKLAIINSQNQRVETAETIEIFVGEGQPLSKNIYSGLVLKSTIELKGSDVTIL
jgi:beta-glucosidase